MRLRRRKSARMRVWKDLVARHGSFGCRSDKGRTRWFGGGNRRIVWFDTSFLPEGMGLFSRCGLKELTCFGLFGWFGVGGRFLCCCFCCGG